VDPKLFDKHSEDRLNLLILARTDAGNTASYWAGFGWDRSGQFANFEAWKAYVDLFAQGLQSPIEVTVVPE
jgi:hypothetical protein